MKNKKPRKQIGTYLNSSTVRYLTHPRQFLHDFLLEMKSFIQRGMYGVADCDIWGLNSYLSDWFPYALRKMGDDSLGCPQQLFDAEDHNNECHKWKEVLEEIAQGFDAYKALDEMSLKWTIEKQEEVNKKLKRSFDLLSEYFPNLWD